MTRRFVDMAHRVPGRVPEDPRMRARLKFHDDGRHRVTRAERPDHYWACDWCEPDRLAGFGRFTECDDREVEVFRLPASAADDPMGAIMGRIGQ